MSVKGFRTRDGSAGRQYSAESALSVPSGSLSLGSEAQRRAKTCHRNPDVDFLRRIRAGVTERRSQSPFAGWDVCAGLSRQLVQPFREWTCSANTGCQKLPGIAMPGLPGNMEFG